MAAGDSLAEIETDKARARAQPRTACKALPTYVDLRRLSTAGGALQAESVMNLVGCSSQCIMDVVAQ